MFGGEVREAVSGHLIGHIERLLEIFDRQVVEIEAALQQIDSWLLGDKRRGREVVGFNTLAEVVAEVSRRGMIEGVVAKRLQDDRARGPQIQLFSQRDVDDSIFLVGDRPG